MCPPLACRKVIWGGWGNRGVGRVVRRVLLLEGM